MSITLPERSSVTFTPPIIENERNDQTKRTCSILIRLMQCCCCCCWGKKSRPEKKMPKVTIEENSQYNGLPSPTSKAASSINSDRQDTPKSQTAFSIRSNSPTPTPTPSVEASLSRGVKEEPEVVTKIKQKWAIDKLKLALNDQKIHPMAKSNWSSKETFDLQVKLEQFIKSDNPLLTFAVFDESGIESRRFCAQFGEYLFENYEKHEIVPFIIPLETVKDPNKAINEAFEKLGLNDTQKSDSKKLKYLFIFLECAGQIPINLYSANHLNKHAQYKGKTLNASCSKGLKGSRDQYMLPYGHPNFDRLNLDKCAEAFILPSNDLKLFTQNDPSNKKYTELDVFVQNNPNQKKYVDYIIKIPQLKELTTRQHFLSITLEVLQKFPNVELDPSKVELKGLIKKIIDCSIEKKIQELKKAKVTVEPNLKEKIIKELEEAAQKMKAKNLDRIVFKPALISYDDDEPQVSEWEFLKNANVVYCSPLEQIGDKVFSFPPTLLDYFARVPEVDASSNEHKKKQ